MDVLNMLNLNDRSVRHVPPDDRALVKAALRSQNWPVTDRSILRLYLATELNRIAKASNGGEIWR